METSGEGQFVLCEVVLTEIAPVFDSAEHALKTLDSLGIRFDPINRQTEFEAGQLFRRHRQEGGPRRNLIPDFLTGAHAFHHAIDWRPSIADISGVISRRLICFPHKTIANTSPRL